jgi:cell division protein FtsB
MMRWFDILTTWLPMAAILVVIVLITRHQMRSYGRHVDRVQDINDEILALNRKNHELALEQLSVLREIKTLLEDRKS